MDHGRIYSPQSLTFNRALIGCFLVAWPPSPPPYWSIRRGDARKGRGVVTAGVRQRACSLWRECVIDSRGVRRVRVRGYVACECVVEVMVVAMSARIEAAASSAGWAVVRFAGIFR